MVERGLLSRHEPCPLKRPIHEVTCRMPPCRPQTPGKSYPWLGLPHAGLFPARPPCRCRCAAAPRASGRPRATAGHRPAYCPPRTRPAAGRRGRSTFFGGDRPWTSGTGSADRWAMSGEVRPGCGNSCGSRQEMGIYIGGQTACVGLRAVGRGGPWRLRMLSWFLYLL